MNNNIPCTLTWLWSPLSPGFGLHSHLALVFTLTWLWSSHSSGSGLQCFCLVVCGDATLLDYEVKETETLHVILLCLSS